MRLAWVVLVACAPAIGCARGGGTLIPVKPAVAAAAAATPVATGEVGGISVVITGAAWDGYPRAAAACVTPIQITLRNKGLRPILVRYRDFALVGASGQRYRAMPPAPPEPPRPGTQVFQPVYSSYGFNVSPDLHLYFPTFPVADDPFPADRADQQAAFAAWPAGLPSQDLREHALPEGVLEKRGSVTGYLYFRDVTASERRVSFEAHMLGSPGGEEVATAAMPFQIR